MMMMIDDYCRKHGLNAQVMRAGSAVLDASDAHKFPQHIIVHLSRGAGLGSIALAKVVCAHVIPHMPDALKAVSTIRRFISNQQLRIGGCVKVGSDIVMRVLQPQGSSLDEILVCMPQEGVLWPAKGARTAAPQGAGTGKGQQGGMWHAARVCGTCHQQQHICHITGCALHTSHGSNHSSLYVCTNSTACAHAQHKSNMALAELECDDRCVGVSCAGDSASQVPGSSSQQHARCRQQQPLHGLQITVQGGVPSWCIQAGSCNSAAG